MFIMRDKQDLDPEFTGTCSEFNTWEGTDNILLKLIKNVLGFECCGHSLNRLFRLNHAKYLNFKLDRQVSKTAGKTICNVRGTL